MSSFFFLCSFLLLLSPSLSDLFLSCLLWYTCPNFVFLFMLCFLLCFAHSFPPPLYLSPVHAPVLSLPCSSLSAGCRGGTFTFTMSRINLRIREQLFSSLLRQDLGFFQETKTGGAWIPFWDSPGPLAAQLPFPCTHPHPVPASTGRRPGAAFLSFGTG